MHFCFCVLPMPKVTPIHFFLAYRKPLIVGCYIFQVKIPVNQYHVNYINLWVIPPYYFVANYIQFFLQLFSYSFLFKSKKKKLLSTSEVFFHKVSISQKRHHFKLSIHWELFPVEYIHWIKIFGLFSHFLSLVFQFYYSIVLSGTVNLIFFYATISLHL